MSLRRQLQCMRELSSHIKSQAKLVLLLLAFQQDRKNRQRRIRVTLQIRGLILVTSQTRVDVRK